MFNKTLIPSPNAQFNQLLQSLYSQAGTNSEQKSSIEKKFDKIDHAFQEKIVNTITISEYFDQLWKQPDLKEDDKELAVIKLEALQNGKKEQIRKGEQEINKKSANLDVLNSGFQTTPYEDFNYQAKLKNIKKSHKLDMESDLFTQHPKDLDILYSLNKSSMAPSKLNSSGFLHYTGGLCDVDETETNKILKAEVFVKKIKDEKKAFTKKMKQIEESVENRESEEIERMKRREQQEEEERMKEKKRRLENHIKELQARSETRIKESTKWEADYKTHIEKKPMFKDMEDKFKKGFVIPELEDRKKKLQDIRDFHKPIQKEDLLQHEQKVIKLAEERTQERKDQYESSKWNYQKPSFESKYHRTVAEELSKVRKQKDEDHTELLKKKERIVELMQSVKEKHLPKADPQKELELLGLIDKLKKKKDGRSWTAYDSDTDNHIDSKKLGGGYLKSVKEMVQKHMKENPKKDKDETQKKIDEVAYATAPVKKHNYLADLRRENKLPTGGSQVDLILKKKNLDPKERKELLQSEVEKLEEKAKRKEMVKKYKIKRGEEADDDDEVDQIYISAIKAKLQMLGN
jgi:hypothetical protein